MDRMVCFDSIVFRFVYNDSVTSDDSIAPNDDIASDCGITRDCCVVSIYAFAIIN
jgi:hypothetical protein